MTGGLASKTLMCGKGKPRRRSAEQHRGRADMPGGGDGFLQCGNEFGHVSRCGFMQRLRDDEGRRGLRVDRRIAALPVGPSARMGASSASRKITSSGSGCSVSPEKVA